MASHNVLNTDTLEADSSVATLPDFRILNLNEAQASVAVQCHCSPPLPALRSDNGEHISNPSRLFYTCPREDDRCSFFQWGDAPKLPAAPQAPSSTHAIIRALPKSRYDSLVKDNPSATLSYVDEDDGETITIGSGYELEQRLKDPINPAAAPKPAPGASSVFPDDVQLLHNFDLSSRDDKTLHLWQGLQSPWPNVCSHDAPASVWARRRTLAELTSGASDYETRDAFPEQPASSISGQDKQKPLLELFETELSKLVPPQETSPTTSSTPRPKKRVAFEPVPESAPQAGPEQSIESAETAIPDQHASSTDPDTSVPPSAGTSSNPNQRRAGEAFVNGLQTFMSGVGSFAARVDEANPQFREHLSHAQSAGQEAALNLLTRLLPEIQTRAAAAGIRVDLSRMPSSRRRRSSSSSASPPAERSTASTTPQPPRVRSYEAERILATRSICYDNLNSGGPKYRQYLVRWAGCGPGDDVWYDEDNLKTSCQPLIDQFERSCGSSALSPRDAAQIHCRTAANRMVASMVPRGEPAPQANAAVIPSTSQDSFAQASKAVPHAFQVRTEPINLRSPSPQAFLRQPAPRSSATVSYFEPKEPQRASIETISGPAPAENPVHIEPIAEPSPERSQPLQPSYHFDPADVLSQDSGESTLRRVRSVLPMQSTPRPSEDEGRWPRIPGEHGHLRRAKSLAFRERPHEQVRARERQIRYGLLGLDSSPRPQGPSLRRAATLDHKRAQRPDGLQAAEALNNTFEAARERYLSRRAATARSTASSNEDADDKVTRCTNHLISMGYRRQEAEPVAAICDGDVSKALDQLEEDRKAWLWRSSRGGSGGSGEASAPNMPGSWDVYRW